MSVGGSDLLTFDPDLSTRVINRNRYSFDHDYLLPSGAMKLTGYRPPDLSQSRISFYLLCIA